MPNIAPALALLKKPIEDVYEVAKGASKEKIQLLRAQARVKDLYTRLASTQKVKTIWHTERALSLSTLFHPVSIRSANGAIQKVVALEDFPDNQVVIAGTGGQGKSFFIRFLVGKEIRSGKRIPLLFELKNYVGPSLEAELSGELDTLVNLDSSGKVFDSFASAGRLSIFLDGFDEVDPEKIRDLGDQIQRLSEKYPDVRLVITSRPDSGVEYLRSFVVFNISPLTLSELPFFYKKIIRDVEFTKRLVAAIEVSPVQIKDLISTPLLATLLAMSYKSSQRIPPDFVEFYDQLFQVLFVRHDASKALHRPRKSRLSDREIQLAFEAFCFRTRKGGSPPLTWSAAVDAAEEAVKAVGINADAGDVLTDVQKVSCLLVKDGPKLDFAHKSVQEFFAARFIRSRPENVAASIYRKFHEAGKWMAWRPEIIFLEQIDRYRAFQNFFIPDIRGTLDQLEEGRRALGKPGLVEYVGASLAVRKVVKNSPSGTPQTYFHVFKKHGIKTMHVEEVEQRAFTRLFGYISPRSIPWNQEFLRSPALQERSYFEIAQDMGIVEEFEKTVRSSIDDLIRRLAACEGYLSRENATGEFASI